MNAQISLNALHCFAQRNLKFYNGKHQSQYQFRSTTVYQ